MTAAIVPPTRVPGGAASQGRGGAAPAFRWAVGALVAALSVYFYAFMEWLFLVTKESFLDSLDRPEQVLVLLGTALLPALAAMVAVAAIGLPHRLLPVAWRVRSAGWLGFTVSAAVLACCFFLLIDNFTYTVFGFGALTTVGPIRSAYALLLLVLFSLTLRKLCGLEVSPRSAAGLSLATAGLMLGSLIALGIQFASTDSDATVASGPSEQPERRPNILLLASDGVEAAHMSAYGYSRDTTPFLARARQDALVAENAFPNGTATAGSVVAMLTSKSPIHTRVYQYEDILLGADSYEHLPGILRDLGYRTTTVSVDLFSHSRGNPRP